ncbi:Protein of unknown function [Hathewaya proteolytica DSM 3090]|uniref:Putative Se/S carrier protein-like domain-containing protein n=1 Tax=Hathewaya proteolytica DSM 3090 TaxID=1121331 RepID=A0A1M6MBJ8_9CLOT|nr:DUF3343 domain-containing protein [Hathewaya proteolytica]SHJ80797.1 Protein of unknown function [Hathewaya proteolytica DSM 3090]
MDESNIEKQKDFYILFHNYTEGLKLEALLKQNKIKYVISPTPRKLSSFCGMSIKYQKKDEERIAVLVKEHDIKIEGFFGI